MTPLDAFLAAQNWELIARLHRWRVRRSADHPEVVATSMRARDDEEFTLLARCDEYPREAPSVAFVDGTLNKLTPSAWPKGTGLLVEIIKPPPNSFLCMALTREGLIHHPNWRTSDPLAAWDPERHSLLDILRHVQRLLDSADYHGRGP